MRSRLHQGAFTEDQAADFTKEAWSRIGMDPNDRSTWTKEKVHMPTRSSVAFKDFAPKVRSSTSLAWSKPDLYDQAWDAISDLLGGEDKVAEHTKVLNDSFIINLGHEKYKNETIHPRDLDKCVFCIFRVPPLLMCLLAGTSTVRVQLVPMCWCSG
jgi:hypothetical protein